jgi:hypothetical protein
MQVNFRLVGSQSESYRCSQLGSQSLPTAGIDGESGSARVNEKVIHINGDDYWLYGAVNSEANEILQFRLFQTTTKQDTVISRQTSSMIST